MGFFDEEWNHLPKKVPYDAFLNVIAVIIHMVLPFPIYFYRRSEEKQDIVQRHQQENQSRFSIFKDKHFAEFLFNHFIIFLMFTDYLSALILNRYEVKTCHLTSVYEKKKTNPFFFSDLILVSCQITKVLSFTSTSLVLILFLSLQSFMFSKSFAYKFRHTYKCLILMKLRMTLLFLPIKMILRTRQMAKLVITNPKAWKRHLTSLNFNKIMDLLSRPMRIQILLILVQAILNPISISRKFMSNP